MLLKTLAISGITGRGAAWRILTMPKVEEAEKPEKSADKKPHSLDSEVAELWKSMPKMKERDQHPKDNDNDKSKLPSCEFFDSSQMPKNGPSVELVQAAAKEVADGELNDGGMQAGVFDRLFDMKGFETSVQDFVLQDNLNAVNERLRAQGSPYRLHFGFDGNRETGSTTLDVYEQGSSNRVDTASFVIPNYEEFKCGDGKAIQY